MFEGDIQDSAEVFDKDGHRIGTVGQVFVLEGTDTPTWVTVHTGLFGMQESFVPLADATMRGSELVVPYEKGFVKQAPRVAEAEELTHEQEAHLYRYYELEPPRHSAETAGVAGGDARGAGDAHRLDDQPYDERGTQGGHARAGDVDAGAERRGAPDASGAPAPSGAPAAPRSGGDGAPTGAGTPGSGGTPRLRRRVVTEMQTVQVPVQREEIVVEGEGMASDADDDRRERR